MKKKCQKNRESIKMMVILYDVNVRWYPYLKFTKCLLYFNSSFISEAKKKRKLMNNGQFIK